MKKMIKRTVSVAVTLMLLMMLLGIGVANAAQTTDSDTHTVTFNNKAAIRLQIAEDTYGFGDVDPVGSPFYSADDAVNPTVYCNSSWRLYVKGDANFVSGANAIPIGRLAWRAGGAGDYTEMTTSDAQVASGTKTGNAGVVTAMGYRLTITFEDEPADDYSATITYTATTP